MSASNQEKPAYHPHPQWFIDQHTKLFTKVADDADHDLTNYNDGMYHPHGITETSYRHYIWDLIFSGRRIVEERDRYRDEHEALHIQRTELLDALTKAQAALRIIADGGTICMADARVIADEARALLTSISP